MSNEYYNANPSTAADPAHARRVRANLFQAASRYLALAVRSIVPQESCHV